MNDQQARILLVEDDARYARRLERNLHLEGYHVDTAGNGQQALEQLRAGVYDLVLTDIRMPDMDGLQLLERIRSGQEHSVDPDVPVVVLTSINSMTAAIEALRLRASDYLTKEQERDEIIHRLRAVLERERTRRENFLLRQALAQQSEYGDVVAESPSMRAVLSQLQAIAPTDATVLLLGETGVGKDLLAHVIHRQSRRRDRPFCIVNCAALPDDNMFQSELFGHERGAFTGADQQKRGRFELAQGGTVFLDEIGDLSLESQGKLLRALETRCIERLGGTKTLEIDVRFVLATNRSLRQEVERGGFRQDLYYRINVVQIEVPALRQRPQDILPLARYFLERYAAKYRRPVRQLAPEAAHLLEQHSWPGNVRELRNLAERLTLLGQEATITPAELLGGGVGSGTTMGSDALVSLPPKGASLAQIEREAIVQALALAGGVQRRAARLLRISPDRLHARIRKYGIALPAAKAAEP